VDLYRAPAQADLEHGGDVGGALNHHTGAVSNVASRLCDEAKPGQILISPRVLTKVENAMQVEPVGEFDSKGIRRPLAAYIMYWLQNLDSGLTNANTV
jgi:class 3 adenylate cyclase